MKKDKVKLLIIDDDPKVGWILTEGLEGQYDILLARDGIEGIQVASKENPELILLDIKMPGMDGIEVLRKLKKAEIPSEVIMLSGHGETKYIVESIQLGAAEFINKPFDVKEVEIHLQSVLEKSHLRSKIREYEKELKSRNQYENFIGDSAKMVEVRNIIEQVADSDLTVLIRGESGTGKEIVARMLHNLSTRSALSFTKVNCAAIPRDLLEAELFGYEKGAFTGAHKTKPGRFEVANKGTIFLDEIGDMHMDLQSKLLQVLEQQEFVRVGGIQNIKVDVRIICATNRNLEQAIADQRFRDDLFYRLNEITVFLPPLRERLDDILLLVDHFLKKYNALYKKEYPTISSGTIEMLSNFHWPGNVRQLENVIKQIVVREDENITDALLKAGAAMPTNAGAGVPGNSGTQQQQTPVADPVPIDPETGEKDYSLKKRVSKAVEREEKSLIAEVLNKVNWNRRKASEILGVSYRSLLYKIKEYKINEMNS
ncbi:MAG: response regulator [candidate division Zixibacteria bacterium]|nr:response regulator [candidate division Zixibacteria bacterium]